MVDQLSFVFSSESREILATTSNTILFKTINIFRNFYCIFEMYTKFYEFWKKVDQFHSLIILEFTVSKDCGYFGVQLLLFQNTLRKSTCYQVPSTA